MIFILFCFVYIVAKLKYKPSSSSSFNALYVHKKIINFKTNKYLCKTESLGKEWYQE